MGSDTSFNDLGTGSVNLVRSSHSWTETDSAAGFVLRYLAPMRKQLTKVLGSENEADQALKVLLTHLVTAGFGEHQQGKLRDFLVRAIRSCAKARLSEKGRLSADKSEIASITPESKEWLELWRQCLVDRAWRALERIEHQDLSQPLHTILWFSTNQPKATAEQLVAAVKEHTGTELDPAQIDAMLLDAKTAFAQLLADEVVETLQSPKPSEVESEIRSLGMGEAFQGLAMGR